VDEWLDCRYAGQSHEILVTDVDEFPAVHARRNGYARPDVDVEVVALRARVSLAAPLTVTDLPEPARAPAQGPAVVAEPDCTLWVPEGWAATPGPAGALIVART
jgi:5-oxoprolinase (ATP-hydrolysing)